MTGRGSRHMPNNPKPLTLLDKIWSQHVIEGLSDGRTLLHIDRQLIHDGSSRQAFDGMRRLGRRFRNLGLNLAVVDHIISTLPGRTGESHPPGRERIHAIRDNAKEFDLEFFDVDDPRQGIVHVIGPELGFTLPGTTVVCGDSHTATNGALGALAWGIGTTEVMHVMAAQALLLRKPRQMRVIFDGPLPTGVFAKDLILAFIARHGVDVGKGYAVEYGGSTIQGMDMESRMTICNMSIEFGARMGMIAVDETTIQYVSSRPLAPKGALWERAVTEWRNLVSDPHAEFDRECHFDCTTLQPQVSWGNSPEDVVGIDQALPGVDSETHSTKQDSIRRTLAYMDLSAGQTLENLPINFAFIGSCTNSRLVDLQIAADIVRGRKIAAGVTGLVVPGSMAVKAAAEALGLDKIFTDAGFEWRNAGCSMCVASNGDFVPPGQRAISTTNRNFEHRQGPMSRTHLASPAMVAAAAINGRITDIRKMLRS
jgi:3-isopropylmalate/(R)-2-methylmalate dehydratase large subunit